MKVNLNIVSVTLIAILVSIVAAGAAQSTHNTPGPKEKMNNNAVNRKATKTDRKMIVKALNTPAIRLANDEIAIDNDKPSSDDPPKNNSSSKQGNTSQKEGKADQSSGNDPEQTHIKKYDFSIKDIGEIKTDLTEIKQIIRKEVLANLSITLILKKLEVSYQMYKKINDVRDGYKKHKDEIKEKISRIKNITEACTYQMKVMNEMGDIKGVFQSAGAKIDNYNLKILSQLIFKLEENVNILWESLSKDMDDFFAELEVLHYDLTIPDDKKVAEMIKIAVNVATFETDIINEHIEKIESINDLIFDNPKYHHIIASKDEDELEGGNGDAQALEDPNKKPKHSSSLALVMLSSLLIVFL